MTDHILTKRDASPGKRLKPYHWLIITAIALLTVAAVLWSGILAANTIPVTVNSNRLSQRGFLLDEIEMLPLLPIAEALGAAVAYRNDGSVFIHSQTLNISLKPGIPYALISQRVEDNEYGGHWRFIWSYDENGDRHNPYGGYHSEVAPLIHNKQLLVPASFVSQILSAEILTTADSKRVRIEAAAMPRPELPVRVVTKPTINENAAHPEIVALVKKIIQGHHTDYERVLAIYDWITHNIRYDHVFFERKRSYQSWVLRGDEVRDLQEPIITLQRQLGICVEFARLAQAMFDVLGLSNNYIEGFTRDSGARVPDTGGHAWNDVMIDGRWIFVDTTWGRQDPDRGRHATRAWFDTGDIAYLISHGRLGFLPTTPTRLDEYYFNIPMSERSEVWEALQGYANNQDWVIKDHGQTRFVGYKNGYEVVVQAYTKLSGIFSFIAEEQIYWRHTMKLTAEGEWIVLGGERVSKDHLFYIYDAPYDLSVRELLALN